MLFIKLTIRTTVNNFKQAVKQINAMKPDMVFICGDLVNKADDKSFKDFNIGTVKTNAVTETLLLSLS